MARKDKGRVAALETGAQTDAAGETATSSPAQTPWTPQDWLFLTGLTLASLLLRVWRLEIPNEQIFDEVYHARTALEFINGLEPYEWTHPPLGKLLIVPGILYYGFNGFGFRIVPCLFGALTTALVYVMAFQLFRNRFIAVVSTFLLNLDGVFFVQSRVAMTNIIVNAFQMVSWIFLWRYLERKHRPADPSEAVAAVNPLVHWMRSNDFNLCLAGIGYGLAIATRWSANFLLGGILLWLAWDRLHEWVVGALQEKEKGRRRTSFWERLAVRVPWTAMVLNLLVLPYLLVVPWLLYLAGPRLLHVPSTGLKIVYVVSLVPLLYWLTRGGVSPDGPALETKAAVPVGTVLAVIGLPVVLAVLYAMSSYANQPEWMLWNRLVPGFSWDFVWLYLGYTLPVLLLLRGSPLTRWAGGLVFYLLYLPSAIYALSYIPWLQQQHSIWEVIWKQKDMWGYHAHLNAAHPYYSPWWSWPWMARPTWYYYAHNTGDTVIWGIDCVGNPAIWWLSVPVMFVLALMVGWRAKRASQGPHLQGGEILRARGEQRPSVSGSLWLSLVGGLVFFGLTWFPLLWGPSPTPPATFNISKGMYFFEFVPFVWTAFILWAVFTAYRLAGPEGRCLFPSPLLFLVLGFAFAWLPWGLSPRQRIYMHYLFEGIPFVCVGLAYLLYLLWESPSGSLGLRLNRYISDYWGPYLPESWNRAILERRVGQYFGRWLNGVYLTAATGLFVFFYPMVAAFPMQKWYYQWHIWSIHWI